MDCSFLIKPWAWPGPLRVCYIGRCPSPWPCNSSLGVLEDPKRANISPRCVHFLQQSDQMATMLSNNYVSKTDLLKLPTLPIQVIKFLYSGARCITQPKTVFVCLYLYNNIPETGQRIDICFLSILEDRKSKMKVVLCQMKATDSWIVPSMQYPCSKRERGTRNKKIQSSSFLFA